MPSHKKLTKEQKFNLEMIYKPMYNKIIEKYLFDHHIVLRNKNCTETDILYIRIISQKFRWYGDIIPFLDLYKDYVIWNKVLNNNAFSIVDQGDLMIEICSRYKEYLTGKVWRHLSANPGYYGLTDEFVRKFKDNLDWYSLSEHYRFTKEFFLEMKDKIDFYHFFNDNKNTICYPIKKELLKYLKEKLKKGD